MLSLFPPHDIAHISRIEEEVLQKPPSNLKTIWLPSHSAKSKRYHSCPQQVLRLVVYVSEGFETERSTVAVFFDVAKAFDRQTDISHLGMSALTRQDVFSEQEFLKAPPSLLCCTPRTQTMYRDRHRLASNSRYLRTIPRSLRK
ncbi:hypothetical protein EVAR_86173_1 [Eumeta japonica]|uniref:Uncharacterized protein n=1 Tax=Eumeta variegata TaxID=151549 RepID=A0A4C2A191_EUMVA|nr:hypothetical protein EVAR_86173_1 [Eumeta japonica]